jgi:NhaP-type Na+/H+ or K+/H+ antiporter
MIPTLLAASFAIMVRSLVAVRLERWNIGAPLLMVLAGVAVGLSTRDVVAVALNTTAAQHVAEITLAVLLFVDATEVRGGRLFGRAPRLVARLLFIALPLSLALAVVAGWLLFPQLPLAVLLVVACVVVPSDFAPAERVVRDRGLPSQVRSVLNVESGYNDGIVSPLFLFALILAGVGHDDQTPLEALGTAIPFAITALIAGTVVGCALAVVMDRVTAIGWTTDQTRRIVVLLAPLLIYSLTVAVGGNGFVASFIGGVAFRYVHRVVAAHRARNHPGSDLTRRSALLTEDFRLLEDATALLSMAMWFVVGVALVIAVSVGIPWQILLFATLALTVVRYLPVLLSLLGSRLTGRDRTLVAALGPRGTTTIVFGLLAFNGLPDGPVADTILGITITCVIGSVLLHGLGSETLIRWARRTRH